MSDTVLPDVLEPGLRVVFCGTQAGAASARAAAYYAGPGNRFWRTLHEVGLLPQPLAPARFREALGHGIGLTDVAKRSFGADTALRPEHVDVTGLLDKLGRFRPAVIAFTGKRAAGAVLRRTGGALPYGLQPDRLAGTQIFVLPSPSGLATRFWSIEPWRELAMLLNGTRAAR